MCIPKTVELNHLKTLHSLMRHIPTTFLKVFSIYCAFKALADSGIWTGLYVWYWPLYLHHEHHSSGVSVVNVVNNFYSSIAIVHQNKALLINKIKTLYQLGVVMLKLVYDIGHWLTQLRSFFGPKTIRFNFFFISQPRGFNWGYQ